MDCGCLLPLTALVGSVGRASDSGREKGEKEKPIQRDYVSLTSYNAGA
jgi:hypothetical protein